jgi:F-type H+-transporting ATPase subunit alpha
LKQVAVSKVKAFEDHFLMEMENKHADILAEFKKGNLADESLKKMTELAAGLAAQYK